MTKRRVKIGDRSVVTRGMPRQFWGDIYHYSMTASWPLFFATIAALFIFINTLFALLYLQDAHAIANKSPTGFTGALFFSIETLATVGYGDMHPQTIYGHIVASIEIFFGMSCIALFTGVMFARFSRPRAKILFARNAVVGPVNGHTTLSIRAANARQNIIVEAAAQLRLIRMETTLEGVVIRRIYDLRLERDRHPIFVLGWNLFHVIDASSPLYRDTPDSLAVSEAGLILTINGVDETTSQTMQSRYHYKYDAIRWNHAYAELLTRDADGADLMDYALFHEVTPL